MRTAGNSLDQADQILEMVIRRKMVFVAKQVVGHAVVARIDKNVDIIATSGSLDKALSITGLETRAVRRNDESVHIHSHFTRPTHQMAVYQVAKFLCTRAGQQCQISDRGFFAEKVAGPIDCSAITLAPLSIFIVLLFVHTAAVFAALLNIF